MIHKSHDFGTYLVFKSRFGMFFGTAVFFYDTIMFDLILIY